MVNYLTTFFLSGISPDYVQNDLVALSLRVVARREPAGKWRSDFLLLLFFCGFFSNPGGSNDGGEDEFFDVRLAFSNSCCWTADTSVSCFSKFLILCTISSTSFLTLAGVLSHSSGGICSVMLGCSSSIPLTLSDFDCYFLCLPFYLWGRDAKLSAQIACKRMF